MNITEEMHDKFELDFFEAWGFRAETRPRAEQANAQMWFNRGIKSALRYIAALDKVSPSDAVAEKITDAKRASLPIRLRAQATWVEGVNYGRPTAVMLEAANALEGEEG